MNKVVLSIFFFLFLCFVSFSCKSIYGSAKIIRFKKFEKEGMSTTNKDVRYRILESGNYSGGSYSRGIYISRSLQEALAITEENSDLDNLLHAVDFNKEAVVFVFGGMFNTGGYDIDIDSIIRDAKRKKILATFYISSPPIDAILTQAFTTPYMAIAIEVGFNEIIQGVFKD